MFKGNLGPEAIAQEFKEVRPTLDFPMLAQILKEQTKRGIDFEKAVDNFVLGFDSLRRQRAKRLAQLLPDPCNIATICNVNGEFIYLHEELSKLGKVWD